MLRTDSVPRRSSSWRPRPDPCHPSSTRRRLAGCGQGGFGETRGVHRTARSRCPRWAPPDDRARVEGAPIHDRVTALGGAGPRAGRRLARSPRGRPSIDLASGGPGTSIGNGPDHLGRRAPERALEPPGTRVGCFSAPLIQVLNHIWRYRISETGARGPRRPGSVRRPRTVSLKPSPEVLPSNDS